MTEEKNELLKIAATILAGIAPENSPGLSDDFAAVKRAIFLAELLIEQVGLRP